MLQQEQICRVKQCWGSDKFGGWKIALGGRRAGRMERGCLPAVGPQGKSSRLDWSERNQVCTGRLLRDMNQSTMGNPPQKCTSGLNENTRIYVSLCALRGCCTVSSHVTIICWHRIVERDFRICLNRGK